MSENTKRPVRDYSYTQNRELSWLQFNRRVLEEAADESVPLLERLKFISIFTSNLDEFFMVRVGSIYDLSMISPEEIDNKSGLNPKQQLEYIYNTVPGLMEIKNRLYASVTSQLEQYGIRACTLQNQTEEERKFLELYFQKQVRPILSPQIVDSHHPFPHMVTKALYIGALLKDKKGDASLGLIPVPPSLPAFLFADQEKKHYIRMEQLILRYARGLFGSYTMEHAVILCVTRNADISFDEEKFEDAEEDFRNRMSKLLKKRSSLSIVRLEMEGTVSAELRKLLKNRIGVENRQIYICSAPLDMKYVYTLARELPEELVRALVYAPYTPRWPEDLDVERSMMEQVARRDRLLFFPFDSVSPFLKLLSEAADDPEVVSIKITIYRLASSSKIAHTLCRAAENGKDVTVLMELRARFDEENNISWSRFLEDAGCHVIYGVDSFKCHSKICLITKQRGDKLRYLTQIGTGNYNEKTNAMYTDLSLMTASDEIGADATAFFQNMLVGNLDGEYQRLLTAPVGIKRRILELIDGEIQKGADGYICIKANSMTEREVMDRLAEASCAGVQVQLILRGICCLRPGIPTRTENVHVTSIVGRYLEHARIYCFGRGGDAQLYISSADLMTRNLNRRVEIACPVEEPVLREALQWILKTQLADNVKGCSLLPDGSYYRKVNSRVRTCAQEVFMEQSFHVPEAPEPQPQTGVCAMLRRMFGGKR